MRAIVRRGGRVGLEELPTPRLRNESDVRIRVTTVGICRTDVYVARGTLPVTEPRVLGHELTGVVIEAGQRAGFAPGDRVGVMPAIGCGVCHRCVAGTDCVEPHFLGVHVDGGFADELILPAAHVLALPADMTEKQAAYVEPVAAALAVLNAPISRDGVGLVLGVNRIASLAMRILKAEGFSNVRNAVAADVAGQDGEYDWAIETEATVETLDAMLRVLKPHGLAVLKSRPTGGVTIDVARAVKKNLRLQAVAYGDFGRAVELLRSGAIDVSELFGEALPLEDFEHAFDLASGSRDAPKIFFTVSPAPVETIAAPARAFAKV